MKKLIFLLLLTGCVINTETPFIITRIEADPGHCHYTVNGIGDDILAPCGLYNIGDTLIIVKR